MQAARVMTARRMFSGFAPLLAGLASLLGGVPAWAQGAVTAQPPPIDAPQPSRAMTIAEALAYAHTHQPAIHAALSRIAERMAQATIPSGRWLPTVAVTAQLYGMTANNTTGSYLSTEFMDVPRIGGTASQSQSTASLSP